MIELQNVSKSYKLSNGRKVILDDVSVTFPTGKSVGILGLNGAGKSTLLRMIGGVEPPDHGHIRHTVKISWPIGFSGGLHPRMTGRQCCRFIARIYGADWRDVEEFAMDFSELGEYFDMAVATYSSGMRARLAFAISMAAKFDCYLVDEVVAVGDHRFNAKYKQTFAEHLKDSTVILVSHNPGRIKDECDIGAVLGNGKLTVYDSVDDALAAYTEQSS